MDIVLCFRVFIASFSCQGGTTKAGCVKGTGLQVFALQRKTSKVQYVRCNSLFLRKHLVHPQTSWFLCCALLRAPPLVHSISTARLAPENADETWPPRSVEKHVPCNSKYTRSPQQLASLSSSLIATLPCGATWYYVRRQAQRWLHNFKK